MASHGNGRLLDACFRVFARCAKKKIFNSFKCTSFSRWKWFVSVSWHNYFAWNTTLLIKKNWSPSPPPPKKKNEKQSKCPHIPYVHRPAEAPTDQEGDWTCWSVVSPSQGVTYGSLPFQRGVQKFSPHTLRMTNKTSQLSSFVDLFVNVLRSADFVMKCSPSNRTHWWSFCWRGCQP